MLALAFWVLKTTGSTARMGLVLFCSFFPAFLTGFLAGTVADRYPRKTVIVAADLARAGVVAGVAVLYFTGRLTLPAVLVFQTLLSVCSAFFDAAVPALIPQITPRDQLSRANSLGEMVRGCATIVGPALGGIAVGAIGYGAAFVVNAVSYALSGILETFITPPPGSPSDRTERSILTEAMAGLAFIFRRRRLTVILAMVAIIHFFVGSIEVVMPVLADALTGSGASNLGFMQAAFGTGAVLTALLLSLKRITRGEAGLLFGAVGAFGAGCLAVAGLLFAAIDHTAAYLLPMVALGSVLIVAATCFRTLLQRAVDNRMAGRVFGAAATIGNVSIPVAMLVYGALLTRIPTETLLTVTGVGLTAMSVASARIYPGQ